MNMRDDIYSYHTSVCGRGVLLPINPRELQRQLRQLKRMGISINQLEGVKKVILELEDKDLVLEEPQVMVMEFGQQKVYQIVAGKVREVARESIREAEPAISISEDDVRFVAEYAGVSEEEARQALIRAKGDIAAALMMLQQKSG